MFVTALAHLRSQPFRVDPNQPIVSLEDGTSALGQKQTYAVRNGMSALPPKADICGALAHVR
jgi:hypothetical protein